MSRYELLKFFWVRINEILYWSSDLWEGMQKNAGNSLQMQTARTLESLDWVQVTETGRERWKKGISVSVATQLRVTVFETFDIR